MNRTYWICAAILVIVTFAATCVFYPSLPDRIPTHWNIKGEIDNWGSRTSAWLMPGAMVLFLGMFSLFPKISPRPFELDRRTWSAYLFVMVVTMGLLAFIQSMILWSASSGGKVDISRPLVAGVMLMLALLGNVLGKIKRNFYMGVRTPWAFASERVWADTHRVAAWWFVGAGLAGFALALTALPVWVAILPLVPATLWPVLFSYLRYKELERRGELTLDVPAGPDA